MSSEDQLLSFNTKSMAQRIFFSLFFFTPHMHCYLTLGSEVVDPHRTFSKEYHHQTHTGIDIGSVTNILILPFFSPGSYSPMGIWNLFVFSLLLLSYVLGLKISQTESQQNIVLKKVYKELLIFFYLKKLKGISPPF